jgi:dihydrolipoamide dehydrogenase
VTVVEIMDRILPVEDEEISTLARKAFEKQGMKILTGAKVTKLDKSKNNVKATIDVAGKTQDITVDRVIMAVGIVGNTENMGLEKLKVKIDKGFVVTDEWLKTGEPNVYAIGDVAGPPMLAHKASHEGVICVEKIAGVKDVHPMKKTNIPGLHLLHAAGGERWPDGKSSAREGLEDQGREVSIYR